MPDLTSKAIQGEPRVIVSTAFSFASSYAIFSLSVAFATLGSNVANGDASTTLVHPRFPASKHPALRPDMSGVRAAVSTMVDKRARIRGVLGF